jgi:hypothetical protein
LALALAGCSQSAHEVCASFEEAGCTADLNGYRDIDGDGFPETACIEEAGDCVSCVQFWRDVTQPTREAGCPEEVDALISCLRETARANGQGVCLVDCSEQTEKFIGCPQTGEGACRKAHARVAQLPCADESFANTPGEISEACVGQPDGCSTFWNGVSQTLFCQDNETNELPLWDFDQFSSETTIDGIICFVNESRERQAN